MTGAEAEDTPPDADDPGPFDGWVLVAEAEDVLLAADTWYPAEVLVLALLARDTVELVEVCEVGGE